MTHDSLGDSRPSGRDTLNDRHDPPGDSRPPTQTIEVDQQMSKLNEEIVKLTKFRNMVEQRVTPPIKEKNLSTQPENQDIQVTARVGDTHSSKSSTPSSLCKISEYGSCEELEMINGSGRWTSLNLHQ